MSSSAAVADPKARGAWAAWVHGDPSKGIIAAKERYPAEYDEYVKGLTSIRGADINFASEAAATFGKADWEAHQAMYATPAPAYAPARLKLTKEDALAHREARRAATANKNRFKMEAMKAEKEAAKSAKAKPAPKGKPPILLTTGIATKALAAGIAKRPKSSLIASPWVAWTGKARTLYPVEYANHLKSVGKASDLMGFAVKARETFGKADYAALAEEYAESLSDSEDEYPAAAAASLPALPALPASAAPSPAALPVAALIEHIDTIHAEIGAIRSLLAGLRGGSKKQKQKQRQKQKTRRSRK